MDPDVVPLSGSQELPPIELVCATFFNMGFERLGPDDATSIESELHRAGRRYEPFAMKEEFFMEPFGDGTRAAEIGELLTNIDNVYKQGMTNLALGRLDPESDADWESCRSSLESAGVPRYLEILEAADEA